MTGQPGPEYLERLEDTLRRPWLPAPTRSVSGTLVRRNHRRCPVDGDAVCFAQRCWRPSR